MKQNCDVKIVDSHSHVGGYESLTFLGDYLKKYGLDKINVVSLACMDETKIMQNILCALFKTMYPGKVYAYGSLMYPYYPLDNKIPKDYNFVDQVKNLMDIGFDGIKMLEGKPTLRKEIGIPLDSPVFDDYYSYIEEQGIHIIFHAADPETFWDKDNPPEFSIEEGWFYGHGGFPEKETIYKEIDGVLNKFPNLKISFAHFYFLSNFLNEAESFFNKWKYVGFDITPGREMYQNFSKDTPAWKQFFTKYQDRIILGTDMEESMFQGKPEDIIGTIRKFIETDDEFDYWGFKIKGLNLEKDAVDRIYYKNFESFAGKVPKEIDIDKLYNLCDKVKQIASTRKDSSVYLKEMDKVMTAIKTHD
jgi:predicted TIM-barrel fold metal-dependent hydrolase